MLPAQPNQSLIDGMMVLQSLAGSSSEVGVRELARMLSLESTRVHRLLRTFLHLGMAERTAQGKYRPGPAIHVLASQCLFGSGLIRRALPVLERLAENGRTVALGVLWRDSTSYLYHGGASAAEALGRVGLYPATRSSIGLALLAQRPLEEVDRLYRQRQTPGFAGLDELKEELRLVRSRGFAVVDESARPLRRTVAVTVGMPAYAGVAVAGAVSDRQLPALVGVLRQAAQDIDNGKEQKAK
jgi:DNA-binding IclR family transcriptional regulator